jgi:hypothetical protein
VATDCEEVCSLTDIVVSRKPDIFAHDWHLPTDRDADTSQSQDATLKG